MINQDEVGTKILRKMRIINFKFINIISFTFY